MIVCNVSVFSLIQFQRAALPVLLLVIRVLPKSKLTSIAYYFFENFVTLRRQQLKKRFSDKKFPRKYIYKEIFMSWLNNLNIVPKSSLIVSLFCLSVSSQHRHHTIKLFLCRSPCAATWSYWWQFTGLPKLCHSPSLLLFLLYFFLWWESWLLTTLAKPILTILFGSSLEGWPLQLLSRMLACTGE